MFSHFLDTLNLRFRRKNAVFWWHEFCANENMKEVLFEWDELKNIANIKKHGISFQEAKTCFEDGYAEVFPDLEHSIYEERYIFLGISGSLRTLVVI